MPTLISSHKNKVTVSKLKIAYSTLSQAFQMSESVNGSSADWEAPDTIGAQAYYEKYWKPYFNNPTRCNTYRECGYPKIVAFHHLNGVVASIGTNADPNSLIEFYLPDGTLYMIYTTFGGDNGKFYVIYVDINGGKGPNVFGKDLFKFRYILGKGIYADGHYTTSSGATASTSEIEQNCSNSGLGTYCAARIMNDGWKIKY